VQLGPAWGASNSPYPTYNVTVPTPSASGDWFKVEFKTSFTSWDRFDLFYIQFASNPVQPGSNTTTTMVYDSNMGFPNTWSYAVYSTSTSGFSF
jgi:hypothetical protein